MSPKGKTARLLIGVLLLALASFTFSTCGGTGIDLAGGGVSGTGDQYWGPSPGSAAS